MPRDNLSLLFKVAVPPRPIGASDNNSSDEAATNFDRSDRGGGSSAGGNVHASVPVHSVPEPTWFSSPALARDAEATTPARNSSASALSGSATQRDEPTIIDRDGTRSDGDLLVDFADAQRATASSDAAGSAPPASDDSDYTKPGTESIRYLKRFGSNIGSIALKPLRELQLAEKLNAMNLEMEELQHQKEEERMRRELEALEARDREGQPRVIVGWGGEEEEPIADRSGRLSRELQRRAEEEACERVKREADVACRRASRRYDALVKFLRSCPTGTYEEYVEFLLMGGGRTEDGLGEDYDSLMFENFYDEDSEYRKLWNDNLTTGLPDAASALEGRSFAPAGGSADFAGGDGAEARQRNRTFSSGDKTLGRALRERTFSEGDRINKQLSQVDREKIKQGLGSAVNALSNASSFALRPLRDLQLAERINAINLEREEEEARREVERYERLQEDDRHLEEAMKLKKEAEESCLAATREHLLNFVRENPDCTYGQWIEDFHPENAHDGTLLEGLGKTIDHRFYVEESDHRRLWNENLAAFLDPSSGGRDFVPARRQMNDDDAAAEDILSGSVVGRETFAPQSGGGDGDLISFD